ncbi:MAG TPA: Nif3-like dinuclear metal center hexameric protein, partial [Longimicrobiales bacterium]|nr:Nif3-like dinuclear metal center hexameric protein [Longimicrobiales bacterium]
MVKLSSLVDYLDGYLSVPEHPDYRTALNGLQVQGREEVKRIAAAVDSSEAVIADAVAAKADLLLVHHGLFWDGLRPLTGRRFRRVQALVKSGTGLYSAHLPLDGHPEVGNCILLARALELEVRGRFGEYEGAPIGWWGTPTEWEREALVARCGDVLGGPVQLLDGGPEKVHRVAVVTGGGGSFIEAAARAGVDTLVTGEGSHHTFVDAHELGVNVLYGGHYRTETFGVKALAEHLAGMFHLE